LIDVEILQGVGQPLFTWRWVVALILLVIGGAIYIGVNGPKSGFAVAIFVVLIGIMITDIWDGLSALRRRARG
jgi:hypothetical protein